MTVVKIIVKYVQLFIGRRIKIFYSFLIIPNNGVSVRNCDGGVWGRTQMHRVVEVKKGIYWEPAKIRVK